MISLFSLWLPIVVAAVFVFAASSMIHMFLKYHASDYKQLPDEKALTDALRPFNLAPGAYHYPRPDDMKQMKTPEFQEKFKKGPVGFITVFPNQIPSMGKNLGQWFVFNLVVAYIAAYITSRALPVGAPYLEVFRFAGATTFCCYGVALWQESIWFGRAWAVTLKNTVDALIFALLSGGVFGWLWPR